VAVADYNWFESCLAPRPGERLVEVERLRALNEDCVPLLCDHLRDPRLRVRTVAAWTLADVGDERAVGPLCEALESADRGLTRWARALATGVGLAVAAVFTFITVIAGLLMSHIWCCTDRGESFANAWQENTVALRSHEVFLSAVVTALDRIIDRHPIPAARRALKPLQRLAEDTLRHQSETREHAKRTAHRIHLATHNRRRLPIACVHPSRRCDQLPLPVEGV
jgi:hypothetical protein